METEIENLVQRFDNDMGEKQVKMSEFVIFSLFQFSFSIFICYFLQLVFKII